jgi:hypothetical protein
MGGVYLGDSCSPNSHDHFERENLQERAPMNTSDLEETKHVALQKFLYVAANTKEFRPSKMAGHWNYNGNCQARGWCVGDFDIVMLNGQHLHIFICEERLDCISNTPKKYKPKYTKRELDKAKRDFDANPYAQAFRKIEAAANEKAALDSAAAAKKAEQDACLRIQAALLGQKKPEPKQSLYQHPETKPKSFWETIWRWS